MICLGWPIGIRFVVVCSIGFLGLGLLASFRSQPLGGQAFPSEIAHNLRRIWEYVTANAWIGFVFIFPYYLTICQQLMAVIKAEGAESLIQRKRTEWTLAKVLLGFCAGLAITVLVMFVIIGSLVWFEESALQKFVMFLPCVLVSLLLNSRVFIWLWRTSPKRS